MRSRQAASPRRRDGGLRFSLPRHRLTMAGDADGIVTAPLHKEGLHAAGLPYPGHTEILAERTGVKEFAMVLAVDNLAVAHVTLHMALRDVFRHLTTRRRAGKGAAARWTSNAHARSPAASRRGCVESTRQRWRTVRRGGSTIIAPAVEAARKQGLDASGPWPCDTLFVRAHARRIRWHRGHVSRSGPHRAETARRGPGRQHRAGLPIVRTSVRTAPPTTSPVAASPTPPVSLRQRESPPY